MKLNLWYKKISIFVLAGIAYGAGIFLSNQAWGVNNAVDVERPLIALGQLLAITGITILFSNKDMFHRWLIFTAIYIPIAVALDFVLFPTPIGLGFMITAILPRTTGIPLFGGLYTLLTICFVSVSWLVLWIRRRRHKRNK
jgi:hypothetical protein